MENVEYIMELTGSRFFDTVIRMRANALAKAYPGVEIETTGEKLRLFGALSPEDAGRFREELGFAF